MEWWSDGCGEAQYSNSLLYTREELYGNDV